MFISLGGRPLCVCGRDKSSLLTPTCPPAPRSLRRQMDNGRTGQDRLRRTMGCLGPSMTLLALCVTFLTFVSDAAAVSSRLPTHVVMSAVIVGMQKPLNQDYVSLSWEYNGRPLAEYKNHHVTSYDPRVSLPQEQFKDGNFSLILNNITIGDSGNYTCLIQYDNQHMIILYALRVEKHRIQLFDLSPKRAEENTDDNALALQSISSRLPTHVVMTAIIVVDQEPLNLDYVSLTWEHNRRPMVEYKNNHVTSYDPRVSMPRERFKDGNFSLILNNITINDSGIYTCLIQYDNQQQIVQYALEVEKNRIQLLDLSPKKVVENMDETARRMRLVYRSSKKLARESRQPTSGLFLQMGGIPRTIAKTGENVSLMCKFNTDPSMELTMLNISWSKNGVTKWILTKDFMEDQARLEELSRGKANLNLTSVQRSDSGNYICNIEYKTLQKNLSTILIVTDDKDDPILSTLSASTLENNWKSTFPSFDKYRKEKIGMVVGVVAIVNCLAFLIYCCVSV